MKYRCIDFETTGIPSENEHHAICEAGWCDVTDDVIGSVKSRLVNPGRPIPVQARAVHHIKDADVVDAILPSEALMTLMTDPPDYFVAHNLNFEKAFFGGGDVPWLCTYKTALRVWPEAPGHKLQELRYFLDVDADADFDASLAERPHRAPDDAFVCAFVLRKLLTAEPDVAKLARWSAGPALLYMCFMKKHRNVPWAEVARTDREYLVWIWEKSDVKDKDILATVKYWLRETAPK